MAVVSSPSPRSGYRVWLAREARVPGSPAPPVASPTFAAWMRSERSSSPPASFPRRPSEDSRIFSAAVGNTAEVSEVQYFFQGTVHKADSRKRQRPEGSAGEHVRQSPGRARSAARSAHK
ncbi:hypothetical protein SKAU_G00017710 [Synaphobranchus kaupii]|uniref:Uncharacterized protein n=1 Tax=Synaphobranchus kaupii TaxID=118154 RepID=A0A9Q1GC95_SYNKA|nr:hypothetical protein SKAU_G00017710 [Synaphobranchus kaupii]